MPLLAVCLVLARGGQEADLVEGRWKDALPKSAYQPLQPDFSWDYDEIERNQPSLTALPGGRALVVASGWQRGVGDHLYVAELQQAASPPAWQTIPGVGGEILRPTITTDAAHQPLVFWTQLNQGRAELRATLRTNQGWQPPVVVRAGELPSFNQECLRSSDGHVWLAWQEFVAAGEAPPGRFEIFLARWEGEGLGPPIRLTDHPFSDWDPVLCSTADGLLWISWVRYSGRDYEVFLRSFQPANQEEEEKTQPRQRLGPLVNLSADAIADDIHPSLTATPDGRLWIAFDKIRDLRRGRSSDEPLDDTRPGDEASLHVLCYHEGKVEAPACGEDDPGRIAARTLFSWSGGQPRILADAQGRVFLLYRYFDEEDGRGAAHSYPVLAQTYTGKDWTPAQILMGSEGDQEPPVACALQAGIWAAWHVDRRVDQQRTKVGARIPQVVQDFVDARGVLLCASLGPNRIAATRISGPAEPPTELSMVPRVESKLPLRPHPLGDPETNPILLGQEHYEIEHGERRYQVYWGDLHRHSSVSRCLNGIEPHPRDRYVFGRDVCLYDFYALTDHSGHIDPFQWRTLSKLVDLFQTPAFCTLQGYEWSSGRLGHQNVILRGRLDQIVSPHHPQGHRPDGLWSQLPEGQALTIPHHVSHTRLAWDWNYFDDRFLRLVEIYQAARGNFEFPGCFRQARSAAAAGRFVQDALQLGHKFGLVASTDHGAGAAYAAVLSEELSREAIFDALYARRTYASTTKGIFLDFRVQGALMGSSIQTEEPARIELTVKGTDELAEVLVFRNGKIIHASPEKAPPEVPEDTILELKWWDRSLAREIPFRVQVDHGKLSRVADPKTSRKDRIKVEDDHTVSWTHPRSFESSSPSRRMRLDEANEDSRLSVTVFRGLHSKTLKELREKPLGDSMGAFTWVLQLVNQGHEVVPQDQGLGSHEYEARWQEKNPRTRATWYYARVIQRNGEMAWSSPIFIDVP